MKNASIKEEKKASLHLRLTCDDWLIVFNQLDRSELGVFYYIKTQDPFGDRTIDITSSTLAELLGIHRTSVSRALKSLSQKGLISLEIVSARVSIRISQKLVCMDAQEVCMDAQEVCMDAQEVCMDAQPHNIDCARAHTNSDLIKTNLDKEYPPIVPQIFSEEEGGNDFLLAEVVSEDKEVVQVEVTSDEIKTENFGTEKVHSLSSIVPVRENDNQIQKASPIQQIFEETGKVLSYGIEYKTWMQVEIGDVIKHYRRSGKGLNRTPNDIYTDFKVFLANKNSLSLTSVERWISNCEKDPLRWTELRDMVAEWMLAKATGNPNIKIAREVSRKPLIELNLNKF